MKRYLGLAPILLLAGGATSPADAAAGPSFSCTRARTADERTICRSAALMRQDRELAAAYLAIRHCKGMGGRDLFIAEQAHWLRLRRGCGANASCIAQHYRVRLGELRPIAVRARAFARRQECPAL